LQKSLHLTVVGSAALDTIETPHGSAKEILGGSAFYLAAAGSLFAPVHIVAVVGEDFDMQQVEFLRQRGVDLTGVDTAKGNTFRWHGRYHENMNLRDTIMVDLGVFQGFEPHLPTDAAAAEILMLANIDPGLQEGVLSQMKKPQLIAYDTMNHWITGHRSAVEGLLKKVDLVLLNDEELKLLAGGNSIFEGAERLMKMGPRFAVVKKGEHGSILFSKDQPPFLCPAFPISHPKDPTGAGDSFAGGMLGFLAATGDLGAINMRRAVVFGGVVASFTVEEFGVKRLEQLTMNELDARFCKFQEMVEF